MKKLLIMCMTMLACLGAFTAQAEETVNKDPVNWEISMMPKPTEEEQEAARWSIVVENNLGIYAYDMGSFAYTQVVNGLPDKNIIAVMTKTVFTDKDTLKKLNEKYKAKLAKKEKVQYCEILMTFNLAEKSYAVTNMDVFGSKKTLLQHSEKALQFVPVPQGSFAEAMLEICQQAVANEAQQQEDGK
ncbi:MAG: hypothetical protein ACI3WU_03355 [Phascolarctobacterium sp.]